MNTLHNNTLKNTPQIVTTFRLYHLLIPTKITNFALQFEYVGKMRTRLISIVVTFISIVSCSYQKQGYKDLIEIDSLLSQEKVDSALYLIEHFSLGNADGETSAYYNLLLAQARYKAYKPIKSDSIINLAIEYYKESNNSDKLARCYYYRGGMLYDLGANKEALDNCKLSENLLRHSDNYILKHNVYYLLSSINFHYNEYELALSYAKKALECSEHTKKENHLICDYEKLLLFYNTLGYKDSSLYYVNRSIKLVNSMPANPPDIRATYWGNLGVVYASIDPDKAEAFLEKSISLAPLDNVYGQLADISLKKGDTLKAKRLLIEGLSISESLSSKAKITRLLGRIEQESGHYQQASEWMRQAQQLKDSLTRQQREDNIRAQQIAFDREVGQKEADQQLMNALLACGIILFGSATTFWYLRRRARKAREKASEQLESAYQELAATQDDLSSASQELKSMARQLKSTSKKMDKLEQERREQRQEQRSQGKTLENGHRLYTELLSGGNMLKWQRKDVTDFIAYYRQTNPDFAEQADRNYGKLTPNQAVYLILKHLGKADDDIIPVMGITPGAFRTMCSRITQKD